MFVCPWLWGAGGTGLFCKSLSFVLQHFQSVGYTWWVIWKIKKKNNQFMTLPFILYHILYDIYDFILAGLNYWQVIWRKYTLQTNMNIKVHPFVFVFLFLCRYIMNLWVLRTLNPFFPFFSCSIRVTSYLHWNHIWISIPHQTPGIDRAGKDFLFHYKDRTF